MKSRKVGFTLNLKLRLKKPLKGAYKLTKKNDNVTLIRFQNTKDTFANCFFFCKKNFLNHIINILNKILSISKENVNIIIFIGIGKLQHRLFSLR